MNDTVNLYPRGWLPSFETTGGQMAPTTIIVPRDVWLNLGKPADIEAFYQATAPRFCTCSKTCPVHGKPHANQVFNLGDMEP